MRATAVGNGIEAWALGVADGVWPWLSIAVLGAAAILSLASGLAPLRGLAAAVRGWRDGAHDPGERGHMVLVAAAAGMGGVTGATLAVTAGGPGALPWMWIATALGMGLAFAEGALGSVGPRTTPSGLHLGGGAIGRLLTPIYALAILAVAVLAGAMLQTHEAAAVLEQALWVPPPSTAVGLALVAVVFVFSPLARNFLLRLVPAALILLAATAAVVVFSDGMYLQMRVGDAFNAAFQMDAAKGGTAGGVVAVAIHHGVLRATLAGHAGLGTAGLARLRTAHPGRAGAMAMLVAPVTAGVLGTLTALVLLTGNGPESYLGRPDTTAPDTTAPDSSPSDAAPAPHAPALAQVVAGPNLVPLERGYSQGLSPSQQVGQTIVMTDEAQTEAGKHYGMVLRPHPRGHAMAKFDAERNAVILPAWAVSSGVNEIIFRAKDADHAKLAAWDVRIPCNREVRSPKGVDTEFLKLTPKDPSIKLSRMVERLRLNSQVYVPLGDYAFVGRVARATTAKLGTHLAMFEPPRTDRAFNPKLHEFYRNAYRGPYADDGTPAPPFGFVAEPNYLPKVGSIVRLALQSHPRGEPFIAVTRGGDLEAPPWDFLLRARHVVLRHDTDPARDVYIPVTPRYQEFRIHLDLDEASTINFSKIASGWNGPFVIVPDFVFEAEVHSDERLPESLRGRRTLVVRHPSPAPQGPHSDQWPYTPHPGDVLAMGMHGPVLAAEGAAVVAMRVRGALGPIGTLSIVGCTVILALASIVAWCRISDPVATALGGPRLAKAMPLIVLAAATMGAWVSLSQLMAVLDVALALAVATNIVCLLASIPRVIRAGRDLG